ncbi:hypothetical protein [Sphingobacterium detergens]|uniref:hypothetical protein n=1 Tax=Sphingobacterium detergens TaxID=1145106 RepID=UPI003AAD20AD
MSKNIYAFLAIILLLFQNCSGQKTDTKFYDKDFKWSIQIPKDFTKVSAKEWAEKQQRGENALEKTTGEAVINEAKTIFVFKTDDMNYFEANYQPFDINIDGDYRENNRNVNHALYQTFRDNMPNARIDTLSSTEKIDSLFFYKYETKIYLPNNQILDIIMYSKLFDKKEFTVNIMFADPKRGKEMVEAWKNSKFEK